MDNLPNTSEQNIEQPVILPPPKINPMFIIGGLILIAIILTGGIFIGKYLNSSQKIPEKEITPTPTLYPSPTIISTLDPTANWKTYINTEYNYVIKYPSNLTVGFNGMRQGDIQKSANVVLFEDTKDKFESPRFTITVMLGINTLINQLESVANTHYQKLGTYRIKEEDKDTASKNLGYIVGNNQIVNPIIITTFLEKYTSFQYTIKGNTIEDGAAQYGVSQEEHKYIWFEANQRFFLISFTDTNIMTQILSTFKFLDQTIDMSNLMTYTDKKYGFSFNLPKYYQTENKTWTTNESVDYLTLDPLPGDYDGCCFRKKSDAISGKSKVVVLEFYQNTRINDWKLKSKFATSHKFIKENAINKNGLSLIKFTALNPGQTGFLEDDKLTGFAIEKDSTLLLITVNHYSENQNEAELFVDQILSTFKFLDQINPTISPDWKTYTSSVIGVEFKYPPDWKITTFANNRRMVLIVSSTVPTDKSGVPNDENYPGYIQVSYHLCVELSTKENVPCDTFDQLIANTKYDLQFETIKETTVTVSGKQGVQVSGASRYGGFRKYTFFPASEFQQSVTTYHTDTEVTYDQILATFKFLE